MKQRAIAGLRFPLVEVRVPAQGKPGPRRKNGALHARPRLEPRDELVELQLLEAASHRLELARGELDQPAALAAELERLPQPRLVRVEPRDDLLEALDGGLVRRGRLCCFRTHLSSCSESKGCAATVPPDMRRSNPPAGRTASGRVRGSPLPSRASAYPRSSVRSGSWARSAAAKAARAASRRSRERRSEPSKLRARPASRPCSAALVRTAAAAFR